MLIREARCAIREKDFPIDGTVRIALRFIGCPTKWWTCRLSAWVVQAYHQREACCDATGVLGGLVVEVLGVNDP